MMKKIEETNHWNPKTYHKHTAFVSQLALPVVDLLAPKKGENILDAGCGEGTLAVEIAKYGANVTGVDSSEAMVDTARAKGVEAYIGSVTDLPYDAVFDAVFSNAVLHWVKDARGAVRSIAKSLKPSGRFVAEFGGEGNVKHLIDAMEAVFALHPEFGTFEHPWYFPSVEAYRKVLESEGFDVISIESIPRPTPIDDITNWFDIFANGITAHLSEEMHDCFTQEVKARLKKTNYTPQKGWMADYVRLRFKAVKR